MSTYYEDVQRQLDASMPWIGLYIAAASAVCTLAMAVDVINGFRQKKLWLPSKYFSLSATSLTLLAVAVKLPTDLNTNMLDEADWFAKLTGLIFLSTAIGNFTSSLGSMNDKEILSNIVALGILVITVVVNVCIQLIQLHQMIVPAYTIQFVVPTIPMLLLLVTLISLAVTVPTTKRIMELKYQELHRLALKEEEVVKRTIDKQKMMRYWVMAQSSSPQFVISRSVSCATSTLICFVAAIILRIPYIQPGLNSIVKRVSLGRPRSVYGDFTLWILAIQAIGVVVGTIAPILRLFVAISFRFSTTSRENKKSGFKDEFFKIETYWIQILVDWRDNFSYLQIHQDKCRKYLHFSKWLVLNFFIGVQILIVVVSKLLMYLVVLVTTPFAHIKNQILKMQFSSNFMTSSDDHVGSHDDIEFSRLNRYVLLLEGETELPKTMLKNFCRQADNMILTGRRKQPQNLISLLLRFVNFSGAIQFDCSKEAPSLHSEEPPNCWTLPLVTLTSIAIALPKVAEHKRKQLVSSVNEGLSLAKLIDNIPDKNVQLVNIRKAADISWAGVALYRKWQDVDLMNTSRNCKNSKEVLQELSSKAEKMVLEFKREVKDDLLMENPLNWPVKVIAANSMYRVGRTTMLVIEGENGLTDDDLFERLSVMIAVILAACLTNLASVITIMCYNNAIENREKNVQEAFILLGKTERIIELLQEREWPSLDSYKATHIGEWRSLLQDHETPHASALNFNVQYNHHPLL